MDLDHSATYKGGAYLRSNKQEKESTQRHVKQAKNHRVSFALDIAALTLMVAGVLLNLVYLMDVGLALVALVGIMITRA